MADTEPDRRLLKALAQLQGKRARVRAALLFERIWPAIWPALGVLGLYLCAGLLSLPQRLPAWPRLALLLLVAAAVALLLLRGLRRVTVPDAAAVDRRLEAMSSLCHAPLQVLHDRPEGAEPAALAVWDAHFHRALGQLPKLRPGWPRPGLARRDLKALRAGLVVLLAASLVVAWDAAPARLIAALLPPLPTLAPGTPVAVIAWVTPPPYTGLAPFFVTTGEFTAPEGSTIAINVSGEASAPRLSADGDDTPFARLDTTSWQISAALHRTGKVQVLAGASTDAGWQATIVPDQAPNVAWGAPPGPFQRQGGAPDGRTKLPWQASDQYGLTSLAAELHLQDRADLPAASIPIALPGTAAKNAKGNAVLDLTANPWAGLPVIAHLTVRGAASHTGVSEDAAFVLPERQFHNPVAQLLIAVRRGLSLHPEDRATAVQRLFEARTAYTAGDTRLAVVLNLNAATMLLLHQPGAEAVPEAQAQLWRLALDLEEGTTAITGRALDAARDAVRDAMEKLRQDPSAANQDALRQALQALRLAVHDHMQALLQNNPGQATPQDAEIGERLSEQALQAQSQAIEQALRDGRLEDAERQLEALDKSLNTLRSAHRATDAQREARRERAKRERDQMNAVQDLTQRESGLLDKAQTSAPASRTPGQRAAEARTQAALRRALGVMMEVAGDLTGNVPQGLGEADLAMRDAATALAAGNDAAAAAAEQKAIAALQQGGRDMADQMASQGQAGQDSAEAGPGQEGDQDGQGMGAQNEDGMGANQGRDPLGRPSADDGSGTEAESGVTVPEERERQQARSLQDELRRRDSDRSRQPDELNYIERLLSPF
jgi:uncharacterized protein (TIGR02302 family)